MIAGWRASRSVAALLLAAAGLAHGTIGAQAQSLSDESVRKLMEYAWAQTPQRFTTPDNKTIEIDKKQPDKVLVPVEVARDVVIAGRRSALAQICNLEEHQVANYRSMMFRERDKKKWSDQQMVFINVLHLTTVQIFAGDITIKMMDDGGKVIEETPANAKKKQSCSEAEAAKLKEQIETYVAQGPKLDAAPTAAATQPAAQAKTK